MPFKSTKEKLIIDKDDLNELESISKSRTEGHSRVERAKVILSFYYGKTISAISRELNIDRPKVERTVNKALAIGTLASLNDLYRSGKPNEITDDAKAWLVSIACQKPKDLGYQNELWTMALLSEYLRNNCLQQGHPSLINIARGTVSKILAANNIQPHKVKYYVERRDPLFDEKMAEVLHVYKEVELMRDKEDNYFAYVSYDEKPGIQAIANTSPDLMPLSGKHPAISRDYEYKRLGTLSLLAGIDLLTGHVTAIITDKHRSVEFIDFLKHLDNDHSDKQKIKIILDNHSAHISKETQKFLASRPNRFEFVFTPKHGSWLNIIESFFGKLARTVLKSIRVESKQELINRIIEHINWLNESPVLFKWTYKMDQV
jgi:transposase